VNRYLTTILLTCACGAPVPDDPRTTLYIPESTPDVIAEAMHAANTYWCDERGLCVDLVVGEGPNQVVWGERYEPGDLCFSKYDPSPMLIARQTDKAGRFLVCFYANYANGPILWRAPGECAGERNEFPAYWTARHEMGHYWGRQHVCDVPGKPECTDDMADRLMYPGPTRCDQL